MRLNSKLTWGLAWAGLALVVAVPSADYLTSGAPAAAVLTSDTDPVKTASIDPAPKAPVSIELAPAVSPVKVKVGTPAPVVIPAKVAAPAVATTAPPVEPAPAETQVASLSPAPAPKIAPFPAPVSQRPLLPPVEPDDSIIIPGDISGDSVAVAPPADIPLEPYETDPTLREYLVSRGLLEPGPEDSTASVTYIDGEEYDPDGFYLSDGPNASSRSSSSLGRTRLDLLIGDEGTWELLPF